MRKCKILTLLMLSLIMLTFTSCDSREFLPMEYILNVQVEGGGQVVPHTGLFLKNEILTLEICPESNWCFSHWEGENKCDVRQNYGGWTLLMNDNKKLTAVFCKNDHKPEPEINYTLIVNKMGEGSVEPNTGKFRKDEIVDLLLEPENGWQFASWQGPNFKDIIDRDGSYQVKMDSDKLLIAVFSQTTYNLTMKIIGQGWLEEKLLSEDYTKGALVKLTAFAADGWLFKEWFGDLESEEEQVYLEMDNHKEITAIFIEENTKPKGYYLALHIEGQGKVKLNPPGNHYEEGTIVSLSALAAPAWEFASWKGDLSNLDINGQVTMDSDKEIVAVFVPKIEEEKKYTLKIEVVGGGRVTREPVKEEYDEGEKVSLTACADQAWEFFEWTGELSSKNPQIDLLMTSNKEIKASFKEKTKFYKIKIDITGDGLVQKNPSADEYEAGTEVTLTAQAANGWEFLGWAGDLQGENPNAQILVDGDKNIKVAFRLKENPRKYTLIVTSSLEGARIERDPDLPEYPEGTVVTLTAISCEKYQFTYWIIAGKLIYENPTKVTMTKDISVVGYFQHNG